jgi:NAD(P)-dependent dehydrogenase (short-subunit alcohol dehydrogenase family)
MTNPYIEIMHLDLTRPDSIKAFANDFQLKYRHLDILINNAGVMGTPETRTADGVELQMATNHFGHFALTALLLDCLARSENARVVTVASLAHKGAKLDFSNLNAEKKYDRWQQYQQASLANVMFAFELQRKLNEKRINNIMSVAAHPGFANTNAALVGPDMDGSWFNKAIASVTTAIAAQSPEMGALPILFAATACQVKGGDYCGPKSFNHLRGYPTVHFADDNAYDVETAGRLWTTATSSTGTHFDFDSAAKSRLNASEYNNAPNPFTGSQPAPLVHT